MLQAELRVLTAAESLQRATAAPAASHPYASYGASQLRPGLSASPAEQRINAALRTGVNGLAPNTASHSANAAAEPADRPSPSEDDALSSADQHDYDTQVPDSQWVWDQLVAQQRGSGYGSDDSQPQGEADARSPGNSSSTQQPSDGARTGSPLTPSSANPEVLHANGTVHHANGYATQTDNPLWSPGSPDGSVSSPTTPSQADAEQNGDRQFGSSPVRPGVVRKGLAQAQAGTSALPQGPGSTQHRSSQATPRASTAQPRRSSAQPGPSKAFQKQETVQQRPSSAQSGPSAARQKPGTSQQTAESVQQKASPAEQDPSGVRHPVECSTAQPQPGSIKPAANGLRANGQAATSGTDAESDGVSTTAEPEGPGTDIYQAAKIMNNKKAAEEFFEKGQQAGRQRNWSQAVCVHTYPSSRVCTSQH